MHQPLPPWDPANNVSPSDAALIAAIEAEIASRERSEFRRFEKYQTNPAGFIEEALLGFVWSKQKEICASVVNNRRTAVQSCHESGKTFIASRIAAWWLSCWPVGDAFVVTLAPTAHQVKALLWRELKRAHQAGGLPGEISTTEWKIGGELVGFGRSPADHDPTAIQGIHAPRVLLLVDEACGVSKTILDAADSIIANEDSRVLMIGNPDDPNTEFGRVCTTPNSGWNVIKISAYDTPNFTGERIPEGLEKIFISKMWVEEKAKPQSWGVDSPIYRAKILGEFPDQAEDSLISKSQVKAAQDRYALASEVGPNDLGVDVARMGGDASVIVRRKGMKNRVEHRHHKRDLMTIVGEVVNACRRDKPGRVMIDDIGMGGGVTDRLVEIQASTKPEEQEARTALMGVEIVPINVGNSVQPKSKADEVFYNLKAEVNWHVKTLFASGQIAIDPDDINLGAQIPDIKYKVRSTGEIQMESKADMKKRTNGVSPDDWDALVLANASPDFPGSGLLDYYRQQAEAKMAAAPKVTTAAEIAAPGASVPNGVRLGLPPGEVYSTVYGMSGKGYQVSSGCITVDPDDVATLIAQGYQRQ